MKILQFGTGRFLRAFVGPIVDQPRSISVVQSLAGAERAAAMNAQLAQHGGFHVWTRGFQHGKVIDSAELVESWDRVKLATDHWRDIIALAEDPELKLVVSNTTAAGLALDECDALPGSVEHAACPNSFPAKAVLLLWQRFNRGLPGLCWLPLELVENNGSKLQELVFQQANAWRLDDENSGFTQWIREQNLWLNNLVDRIVVGPAANPPWQASDQASDPMAVCGEPYRLLAIERPQRMSTAVEPLVEAVPKHQMVTWTENLETYYLRKVRVLNGLHTAMVARFLPSGKSTVLECINDRSSAAWLQELLNEEILPTLSWQGIDAQEFAGQVWERFQNPFFEHRLADIALGHATKLEVRIRSTADEFQQAFGKPAEKLQAVLAAQV